MDTMIETRYYGTLETFKTGVYHVFGIGTISREWDTYTPNGNRVNGRWVFRDSSGCFLDYDQYINDLADRYDIDLYDRFTPRYDKNK